MNVSHIATESLDELEKLCCDLFAGVENKNVSSPEWKEHPFGPDQLQMKGLIVPVKDIRNLNITFPMPDMREHYESQVKTLDPLFSPTSFPLILEFLFSCSRNVT